MSADCVNSFAVKGTVDRVVVAQQPAADAASDAARAAQDDAKEERATLAE